MSTTITTSDTNMREHIGYEVRGDENTVLLIQLSDLMDDGNPNYEDWMFDELLKQLGKEKYH